MPLATAIMGRRINREGKRYKLKATISRGNDRIPPIRVVEVPINGPPQFLSQIRSPQNL